MCKLLCLWQLAQSGMRRLRLDIAPALGLLALAGAACSSAIGTATPTIEAPSAPSAEIATPTSTPMPPTFTPTAEPMPPAVSSAEAANDSTSPIDRGEAAASAVLDLNPTGPKEADLRFFEQLLPRDAIRPVYAPTIDTAETAGLDSEDLVIGVSIGGESRAYPIGPLRFREMVNDELGGIPILVTW